MTTISNYRLDPGNCCVYFFIGGFTYCAQQDKNDFTIMACTEEGEPLSPVTGEFRKKLKFNPSTITNCKLTRSFNNWIARQQDNLLYVEISPTHTIGSVPSFTLHNSVMRGSSPAFWSMVGLTQEFKHLRPDTELIPSEESREAFSAAIRTRIEIKAQ